MDVLHLAPARSQDGMPRFQQPWRLFMHLAADVGGTKTNFALVDPAQPNALLHVVGVSSRDYRDLTSMVREYLQRTGAKPVTAALAVPGPVLSGTCELTNLAWTCTEVDLARDLGLQRVRLLNDLVATATGIAGLPASDVVTLHAGSEVPPLHEGQVRAVIAPGTGLGEAFCVYDGERWVAHPAEGGHAAWGPRSNEEADLWHFLFDREGFVGVETVCSGMGVANVWRWLCEKGRAQEAMSLSAHIHAAADPTKEIMSNLETSERCRLAVSMVADFLAGEASDLAVRLLPTGGIFLGGGLPPRLLSYLQSERFIRRYLEHPQLGHVHRSVPVHVVLNPKAALLGAASLA